MIQNFIQQEHGGYPFLVIIVVLVVAAFMTSVIAQIMGPVAEVLLVLATLAPVFIIIAAKMPIGGDPMLMLCCQLALLNGLGAMLFVLVFFMLVLFM